MKSVLTIGGYSLPIVNGRPFGEVYGARVEGEAFGDPQHPSFVTRTGIRVWMWRKRQAVRFFTATGTQVGPEQSNVAPATCFAFSEGWSDPDAPEWLNHGAQMECGYSL
jgi:hypothetical protein